MSAHPVLALLALLSAAAAPHAAAAGEASAPATVPEGVRPQPTLLRLSATGSVSVTPDVLVARLRGENRSPDPAAAQQALDRRMADAATQARTAGNGLSIQVAGYNTFRDPGAASRPAAWVAQQDLVLRGAEAAPLLATVAQLQKSGLVLESLDWQLSPATRATAEADAETKALHALKRHAAAAAAAMGLRLGPFREINLDGLGEPAPPRPVMRMFAMAAAPPPEATRDDQQVSETATGTVVLEP